MPQGRGETEKGQANMRINDRRQAGRTEEPARRDGLVEAASPRKWAQAKPSTGVVVLAAVLLLGSIAVLRTQTMEFQLVQPSLVPQSGNFFSMQFSNYPPLPNIDEFSGLDVRVGFADTLWGCPQCQQRMQIHDYEERRWRHLDSCQFKTIIVSRVPSVRCPEHGSQTVAVPWAEKYARFTRLFERLAIDVMLECSITGACSILGMSWDEADGIKQRAVKRGLARKVPAVMARLCVDEKGMGQGQNYLTIVAQVTEQQTTVEYVGEERNQASLDAFWETLTTEQLAGVEAVAMDMWEPYVRSTLAHLPGAASKIVHDPFHLVKYMNEAVNEVRKSEHRSEEHT